jgi:hypothetical protein
VRGLRLRQTEAEVLEMFPTLRKEKGEELGVTGYSHITVVGEEARNPPPWGKLLARAASSFDTP